MKEDTWKTTCLHTPESVCKDWLVASKLLTSAGFFSIMEMDGPDPREDDEVLV